MKQLFLCILTLFLFIELPQSQDLTSQIKKAEFLIQHHQRQTNTPGVQVALLEHGELVWSKAYGFADIELSKALQTDTPMRVASISKPMTSVVLGKLVEEGKIDLDEDIRTYVPEFQDKEVPITARHLAASTSGIRHYTAEDPAYNQLHYPTVIDALAPFKNDSLLFKPGTDHHYSSYGWVLLSAAMERASGTSFQELMQSTWTDLEMHQTYFDHSNYHPDTISSQYVAKQPGFLKRLFSSSEVERITVPEEDRSYMYAGGGYVSTAEDLVTMGWRLISSDYLEASTVDILFEDQKLKKGASTHYGLGWEVVQNRTGTPVVFHSGSMSSARSHLVIYPDENMVFAILMNTGDHVFFNDREAQTIAELFLPEAENPQEIQSIAGQWDIETTSLRNKKTKGKMVLVEDASDTISGNITFTRSRKKKTFPVVLAGIKNNEYHLVSVSPMFIDLYVTIDGDSFSGTWLHDFNVKGIPETDPYWKPREIQGEKSNHDP